MNTNAIHSQQLFKFFSKGKLLRYKKGDIILRPEDQPKGIYFISKGYVKSYIITEWGDEKIISIYKSGEFFPIFYIFDQKPITKFYEAMSNVQIYTIGRVYILKYLQKNKELLLAFTINIAQLLEFCYERIDNLEYTKAHARFCSRLLTLSERFGENINNTIIIKAPITHHDIAASIAMSRETASREFELLKKKGIVTLQNHYIVIKDKQKLEQELNIDHNKKLL